MAIKSAKFRIGTESFRVTDKQILVAMRQFDCLRDKGAIDSGTRYAVFNRKGLPYPPKKLLSLAIKRPTNHFSGGWRTNRVFSSLGFEVGNAPRMLRAKKRLAAWPHNLPSLEALLEDLFSKRWIRLEKEVIELGDAIYPGVYLVAHSKRSLQGKPVRAKDIFYVGMSNYASVSKRLEQFWNGLRRGGCHSGADRFYRQWLKRKPYTSSKLNGTLFVTWICIPCTTEKTLRTSEDLRLMGAVADLELCAIARVRQARKSEPPLNAK